MTCSSLKTGTTKEMSLGRRGSAWAGDTAWRGVRGSSEIAVGAGLPAMVPKRDCRSRAKSARPARMDLALDVSITVAFFAVIMGLGAWTGGAAMGGWMRGAAMPLMIIPLLSDWIRFVAKVPHSVSFGFALGVFLIGAGVVCWADRRNHTERFALFRDQRWWLVFIMFVAVHVVVRTWIMTGSVPNPADDTFGGYKSNALLNSMSWPTRHPEAPESVMSYYYYIYAWPAGLAGLLGVSLKAGWWVTAVVFCVAGGMLAFEVILPRLRSTRWSLLAGLALLNGCSLAILLALPLKIPPRDWGHEVEVLTTPAGLYMRVPQIVGAYWAPFAIFASGLLLVTLVFLFDSLWNRLSRAQLSFCILSLGSLAGYCTFHLIGLALVVVPVLAVAVIRMGKESRLGWFARLLGMGAASIAACLPLLLDLAQRSAGTRYYRFRDPLHVWLQTAGDKYSAGHIIGLIAWTLLCGLATNVLIFPILFRHRPNRLPPLASVLLGIFIWGSVLSLFGVTDDFVPKFGHFLGTTLVVVFFLMEERPRWAAPLFFAGLVGPVLGLLNGVRANFFTPKWDGAWWAADRAARSSGEVVFYDIPAEERHNRTPWINLLPLYSRTRFLVPAEQVDDQGQNFLRDPSDLAKLPSTEARLQKAIGDAPSYLLLTVPKEVPGGEELYRSDSFSLWRLPRPANPSEH